MNLLLKKLFLTCLSFMICFTLYSQNKSEDTTGVDYMFKKAQNLAFNGKRVEARKICRQILVKHPDYSDVRVLLGRTYEWDSKPDSARIELKKVIKKGYYEDAVSAIADVEIWENRPDSALYYLNELLKHNPNNVDYLLKKAKVLIKKGDNKGASDILHQILDNIEPANKTAKELLAQMKFDKSMNRIAVNWANEYFDKSSISNSNWIRNWNVYSIEYSRRLVSLGLVQFRTDFGTLNGDKLINKQFDIQAYPGVSKHDYLWVNYGYSPDDDNFARHHAGLELFHSFLQGWEASLGFRYLNFHGNSDVFIYTGSLGKYIGNYWLDFRTYISPSRNLNSITNNTYDKVSKSFFLIARRFFKTSNDYLSLTAGGGSGPNKYTFQEFYYITNSQSVTLSYQRVIHNYYMGASFGIFHQQYLNGAIKTYRYEYDTSLKFGYYF